MKPLTEFQSFLETALTIPRPILCVFRDSDIQIEMMGKLSLSAWPVLANQQRTGAGRGQTQHKLEH